MQVLFKNPKTGELRNVKVGRSWGLFFFSSFLGLPLFLRGLTTWGVIMAALWGISLISFPVVPEESAAAIAIPLWVASMGLQVFFGLKGNEMTAKSYLLKDDRYEPLAALNTLEDKAWRA